MFIELINTSDKPLVPELEEALQKYAPYHEFREQRNRIVIEAETFWYDVRAILLQVDESHIVVWISDWYADYR